MHTSTGRLALVCGTLMLLACGAERHLSSASPKRAEGVKASAAEIARAMVRGKTGALFELREFRFHPTSARSIGGLCNWAEGVRALGLDPSNDVARVFVAASHAYDDTGIAVIAPEVDDARIEEAIARSGGGLTDGFAFPTVTIPIRGHAPHVAALVQPGLLVIVPNRHKEALEWLRQPAELPPVPENAAAQFFAFDPSESLGMMPDWPRTIVAAHAELEFTARGGAVVRFFADSISRDQAVTDAKKLTDEAHRLLAVDLGVFELHLLDPPLFHAVGARIYMETGLLPTDVDWLLRFDGSLGT